MHKTNPLKKKKNIYMSWDPKIKWGTDKFFKILKRVTANGGRKQQQLENYPCHGIQKSKMGEGQIFKFLKRAAANGGKNNNN